MIQAVSHPDPLDAARAAALLAALVEEPLNIIGSATFSSAVYTGNRFDVWNTKPMTSAR